METNKKKELIEEENLIKQLLFRFFPYWPLFLILLIICIIGGYVYLRYATPIYEISATMLIKDEKKGSSDSRTIQELNIFASNDIVENEMEVLHSRGLMNEVVYKLHLYAPVFSEGRLKSISAYTSSPLIVEVKNPADLDTSSANKKIYFTYDATKKLVTIQNKNYPIDEWINTPYGIIKFTANPNLRIVDTKPLYANLISPKVITNSLVNSLEVAAPNKLSSIVTLKLTDENTKRGEDILNELITTYNLASIEDKNEFSAKTLTIVTDRLSYVQQQVDSIQRLINQYKERNGIVNLSQQSTLFLQNVGDNDQKIADKNMQIAVLDEVEKYVNSKDHNGAIIQSTLGINDPVLSNLIQQLYNLEINYQRLKMTATENNPMLVSLADDIKKTKSNILENTKVQRISLKASRNNLSAAIDNYSSKLKNIPEKERDLIEISRQLSVLNNTYDFLLQKKEEASLSNASTVANSRIVDKAQSSFYPTSPKKLIVLLIATIIALGIGCLIVLFKEIFSTKILFRSEIDKYTNIPVAAEIFNINKKDKRITEKEKNTIITEQFRQLSAAMGFYGRNIQKKKLLVTSSIAGEGKSFVSTNLALCLALLGKKVILLDLDFRNPQISYNFNISHEIGISEFLEGGREPYEIIKPSKNDNLFIAGAGSVPREKASKLLLNDKLKELFNYLEEIFDFIIIDTPPVEPISDSFIIAEYCDTSLYVIRHRYTPKTLVRLLDKNNKIKNFKNLSIVFNAINPRGFVKRIHGYGYGISHEYVYNLHTKGKKALT